MSKLVVTGGKPLEGTVTVSGAKNAVLPIIAASLLTREPVQLDDVPELVDVDLMGKVIEALGAKVERDGSQLRIYIPEIMNIEAPHHLVTQMRASIVIGLFFCL